MAGAAASGSADFLILLVAACAGRKSATAAAITSTCASGACLDTASRSCAAEPMWTTSTPAGSARPAVLPAISVTSAPRWAATRATAYPCLPELRLPMKRTGSIGSRVPPAVTSTLHAGQVVGHRVAAGQQQLRQRGDLLGLGQSARAAVRAGQPARRRLEHDGPAAPQGGDVVDGGGVEPHLGVHRGGEQHRTSRGQQRRGQQVVGAAGDRPGQQVGGGGSDDDEVGLLADPDVRNLGDVVRRHRCAPAGRTAPRTSRRRRSAARTRWGPPGRCGRPRRAGGPPCRPCRRRCRRLRRR